MRSMTLPMILAATVLFVSSASASTINKLVDSSETWVDFLVQNVCVDDENRVVEGDPATCPYHRNIRMGEKIPYAVSDYDTRSNKRYQAFFSYPVPAASDDVLLVLMSKISGFQNNNPEGPFQFSFDSEARETSHGYDLASARDPGWISFIRTYDGGCFDQVFSNGEGRREGGWLLFPKYLVNVEQRHGIGIDRLTPFQRCPKTERSMGNTLTVATEPKLIQFDSGKNLQAVQSFHFAHFDTAQVENALERFFFTREYGFTRWEQWVPKKKCEQLHGANSPRCIPGHAGHLLTGRCRHDGALPGTMTFGGQEWLRMDCRDATFYHRLSTPIMPVHKNMGTINGLIDINMAAVFQTPAQATEIAPPPPISLGIPPMEPQKPALTMPRGSWAQSCTNSRIVGDNLETYCRKIDGTLSFNRVAIANCPEASNANGALTCNGTVAPASSGATSAAVQPLGLPKGSWSLSCRDQRIIDGFVETYCQDQQGRFVYNKVSLRDCPMANNTNGQLVCTP